MSYQALYRKWRPSEFEEVKGQDHIVITLKNQIKADRIGHAYLFCGTRGTGKTTILKIINELVPQDAGTVTLGSNVHIGYYDQEHQLLHMEKTIFDEIADDYPDLNNTKVRNVLAAM